jgi:hypothetical protein
LIVISRGRVPVAVVVMLSFRSAESPFAFIVAGVDQVQAPLSADVLMSAKVVFLTASMIKLAWLAIVLKFRLASFNKLQLTNSATTPDRAKARMDADKMSSARVKPREDFFSK